MEIRVENDAFRTLDGHTFRFFRALPLTRCVAIAGFLALVAACNSTNTTSSFDPSGDDDDDDDDGTTVIPGSCNDPAMFESWRSYAETQLAAYDVPGGAIALVCNGRLEFASGIGVTKLGGSTPVDADTRFQLASVTKGLAAAAAVSLEEDGLLTLSAPVSAHVSSPVWGSIPLEKFLSHSSGFSTAFDNGATTLAGQVAAAANQPLWAPPGAVFNYSNVGYSIAGQVLVEAAGKPFADIVQERVFDPAGMTRATMSVDEVLAGGNYAWGTEGGAAVAPNDAYYAGDWYGPMGGAWSSVTDLAHWAEAHLDGMSSLSPSGFENLRTPRTPTMWADDYGLGLEIIDSSPKIVMHSGSTLGYQSDWLIIPELGFAVVALINVNDFSASAYYPQDLTWNAVEKYVDNIDFPAYPQPGTPAELAGTYQSLALGSVQVIDQGGGNLAARFNGGAAIPLDPAFADSYYVQHPTEGEIDFNFWRPNGGPAQFFVSLYGVGERQ